MTFFYWSTTSLPSWIRSRTLVGWFVLCYVDNRQLAKILGGLSAVAAAIMRVFWPQTPQPDQFCMQQQGVRLDDQFCYGRFGCWLADERALKSIVQCKGSGGLKPCVLCSNVVRSDKVEECVNAVGVGELDSTKFSLHTALSMEHLAKRVGQVASSGSAADLDKIGKISGLSWEPHGILWGDDYAARISRFPETIMYAWMHSILASGGIGEVGVAYAVRDIVASTSVSLGDFDRFASSVVFPHQHGPPPVDFFRKRFVLTPRRVHMKGYADDLLSCLPILNLMSDLLLAGQAHLQKQVSYVKALASLVGLLLQGDEVLQCLGRLERSVVEHHIAFLQLCPDLDSKPKLHYTRHLPALFRRFGFNGSCYPMERKHKYGKRVASTAYSATCQTTLAHDIFAFLSAIEDEDQFISTRLGSDAPLPGVVLSHGSRSSKSVKSVCGEFRAGDLLQFHSGTSDFHLGFAVGFIHRGLDDFVAIVSPLSRVLGSATRWRRTQLHESIALSRVFYATPTSSSAKTSSPSLAQ